MALQKGLLLLLLAALKLFRLSVAGGSGSMTAAGSQLAEEGRKSQGPIGDPATVFANTPEEKVPLHSVQEFCNGPEDLSECDLVQDGTCIISAGYLRLWQRRRWRDAAPSRRQPEPRWVEGLRIRTGGDVEVRGAVIQCTQSAPAWGKPAARRRRLRVKASRGGKGYPAGMGSPAATRGGPASKEAAAQRIELCASGSIRILRAARLHCTETILLAGNSVTVAETAEVTATGTVNLRAPPSYLPTTTISSFDTSAGGPAAPGSSALEIVAMHLRRALGVGTGGRASEKPLESGAPLDMPAASSYTPPSACRAADDPAENEGAPKGEPQLSAGQVSELRGGSHGGLGGVASDRCEATAFSKGLLAALHTSLKRIT